jgi:hypothetical protein
MRAWSTMFMLVSVWFSTPARAECVPLDEARFRRLVAESHAALDAGDVGGHAGLVDQLEAGLPCLDFVPSPELWAELLIDMAIVEHATAGDWQTPLNTALRVHPTVNRLVGSTHPIATYAPPDPPVGASTPVPEGVRLYVDGEAVRFVPPLSGLHLVQRRDGDGWKNVLLRDAPVPASFLVEPDLAAEDEAGPVWATLSAVGGLGVLAQRPESSLDFVRENTLATPAVSIASHGQAAFGPPIGAAWDVWAGLSPQPDRLDAAAGLGWVTPWGGVQVGAGVRSVTPIEGEERRPVFLPHGRVLALVRGGDVDKLAWDAGLSGGWGPAVIPGAARAGVTRRFGPASLRVGLDLRFALGRFVQRDELDGERRIDVLDAAAGLALGAVFRGP